MGIAQSNFLAEFKKSFNERLGKDIQWSGGQVADNCAAFGSPYPCRRTGGARATERFELGDANTSYCGWKVVIEFESGQLPLSNILKYWPYVRGELSSKPNQPILICHFSDWSSYATRRDLWEWTLSRMQADKDSLVAVEGKQFDHWGAEDELRASSIASAVAWVDSVATGNAR